MMLLQIIRLTCLILLTFFPVLLHADIIDRVIAVVNDDVITFSEINEEGKAIFQEIAEQSDPGERDSKLQKARLSITEKIIDRKLMLQEAERLNILVNEKETEAALSQLLTNNNATMQQFLDQLAGSGITEEKFRNNLKDQIMVSRLINLEVRSKIIISDEKIAAYYQNQLTAEVIDEQFYILQIGSLFSEDNNEIPSHSIKEKALTKIQKIRILAMAGNDFKALARKYSELPSAADGGDLGFFTKNEMAPAMREAISQLKPGEISNIVEISTGYQLFKLVSIKKGTQVEKAPLDNTLKSEIQNTLYQEEMKTRYEQWIGNLRDQAYIKIL